MLFQTFQIVKKIVLILLWSELFFLSNDASQTESFRIYFYVNYFIFSLIFDIIRNNFQKITIKTSILEFFFVYFNKKVNFVTYANTFFI